MAENQEKKGGEDVLYILKARFKATESNTYGLLMLFISGLQKSLENVFVAASHFSTIYSISPNLPWSEFEENITKLRWKGEISQNITHDLQLTLSNTLKLEKMEELVEYIESGHRTKVEDALIEVLSKTLLDRSVTVEYDIERTTHQEVARIKDERMRKEREALEEKKKEEEAKAREERYKKYLEGSVLLDVELILAPVSGIPIWEAAPGDEIMVKISPETERGNYFIDLLNLRGPTGEVLPTNGVIKEVFVNDLGEYELIVEIRPGIYGKVVEAEKVKIKRYEPVQQAQPSFQQGEVNPIPPENFKSPPKKKKDYLIWIIGGITLILAILILLLLFGGIL